MIGARLAAGVALAFSQYQRKISIAIRPILAARAIQNGVLQPQFGRKPGEEAHIRQCAVIPPSTP